MDTSRAKMTMPAVHLVWFKRDLRTFDHAPLVHAAAAGLVLPIYLAEPAYWQQPDTSARQWRFIATSLEELAADLTALGGPLWVRVGDALDTLRVLLDALPIAAVWSHAETGNDFTFKRDCAVAALLRAHGIPWHEFRQDAVRRGRHDRSDYAAHWAQFVAKPQWSQPESIAFVHALPVSLSRHDIPSEAALGLVPDACPQAQPGGRSRGLRLLHSFLHDRGKNYVKAMSSPRTAPQQCSRLSPHLAYGTVSLREVVQAARARQAEVALHQTPYWPRALQAFASRLAWQSHFMQKLESEPLLEWRNLHPALRQQRTTIDADLLQAYATGRTGLPLIDACMHRLQATGWINFRMRALLAAFGCYHLWQPWTAVGQVLARLFIDYEPGIHWSQMQMQSGSTGINAFRIYNPLKQSVDQDPEGTFIRQWLPALRAVPTLWIHEPWRMPEAVQIEYGCRIGVDYPAPIIEPLAAARVAKARLREAYATPDARAESLAVFIKHGSRKRRRTAQTQAATPQLSLFD
ncbi:MAG TPA: FAD-binding domain-containing protein [Halothiobacillus sp.]|jgi:deoxyribodipyrimidine photo-lyase|nr:FAD-binding domain-containing protein [Halothiobacillus sp.]HQS29849.1 FAD-binding domain-containing protein [Halothiobacillus sp.]HUM99837.1 FAD-binding domain-containing protein [Halothiobacillus sp.]